MTVKNTLLCCRSSGNDNNSKAKQRVARYRVFLTDTSRLIAIFYMEL